MSGRSTDSSEEIDGKTSRSICNAVGERLQRSMRPEASQLPDRLRLLMEALRRQDARADPRSMR
jgi:hypothetical protein